MTIQNAPFPRIIRKSKVDGAEELADVFEALYFLRDAYPGYRSDRKIIQALEDGQILHTPYSSYRVERKLQIICECGNGCVMPHMHRDAKS